MKTNNNVNVTPKDMVENISRYETDYTNKLAEMAEKEREFAETRLSIFHSVVEMFRAKYKVGYIYFNEDEPINITFNLVLDQDPQDCYIKSYDINKDEVTLGRYYGVGNDTVSTELRYCTDFTYDEIIAEIFNQIKNGQYLPNEDKEYHV